MTKEDIIRIAQEAGLWETRRSVEMAIGGVGELERFAALVIANHPPQSYMTWQEGYEAGKQAEREACAKVCEELAEVEWADNGRCAAAIRARGQA